MTVDKLKTISSINNYYFYGGLLSEDRLIREIISFFISNKELFLEIAGRGPLENFVAQMADTYANISFIGFVDNETVIKKSASSNAIFAFYDTSITNNVYACPNKLFEAMILGKPLITNKGTALAKFVKEKHIGYIIDPSPDKIGEILKILARDNVAIENIKLIDSELSAKYSWQTMEKIMVNSYLKLLSD
ncbi:MAG: glycosyltransferase [Candidatus Berkelbacteria bacterium]